MSNIIKDILQKIQNFFDKEKQDAKVVLLWADNVTDKLQAFAESPTGLLIEQELISMLPAPIGAALVKWLPTVFVDLKWATGEAGKSDADINKDALAYLKNLIGDVKAAQYNTLAALTGAKISILKNTPIPIQKTLATAQLVHNPALGAT